MRQRERAGEQSRVLTGVEGEGGVVGTEVLEGRALEKEMVLIPDDTRAVGAVAIGAGGTRPRPSLDREVVSTEAKADEDSLIRKGEGVAGVIEAAA